MALGYQQGIYLAALVRVGHPGFSAAQPASATRGQVRELAPHLGGLDVEDRVEAAWEMAALDPLAGDAVPALTHALGDSDARVRASAVAALDDTGPRRVEDVFPLAALIDDDPRVRFAAIDAVGRIGLVTGTTADAVRRLTRASREGDAAICLASASALKRLGERAAAAAYGGLFEQPPPASAPVPHTNSAPSGRGRAS